MDVSDTIGNDTCSECWNDEKQFVIKLSKELNISSIGGRASVTLFANMAELKVTFSEGTIPSTFESAVEALPFWGGATQVDEGLQVAYDEMFQTSNGMRLSTSKTLILITDGKQLGVNYPLWRTKFNNAKIRVVVVGVGSNVNQEDLRDLVYSSNDFHLADDFNTLRDVNFIKNIKICDGRLYIILF